MEKEQKGEGALLHRDRGRIDQFRLLDKSNKLQCLQLKSNNLPS